MGAGGRVVMAIRGVGVLVVEVETAGVQEAERKDVEEEFEGMVEGMVERGTGPGATVVGVGVGGVVGAGVEEAVEASCSWCRAALCLPRSRSAGPR